MCVVRACVCVCVVRAHVCVGFDVKSADLVRQTTGHQNRTTRHEHKKREKTRKDTSNKQFRIQCEGKSCKLCTPGIQYQWNTAVARMQFKYLLEEIACYCSTVGTHTGIAI